MENCIQNRIRALRVQSHTIRTRQCPPTFQAMMNKILEEFLDHRVVVYLDDILIYSENKKEHIELVKKILAKREEHLLPVSVTKSGFLVESVKFLRYIVRIEEVIMSERKVESVMN